jgi:hypothetical protein
MMLYLDSTKRFNLKVYYFIKMNSGIKSSLKCSIALGIGRLE